MFLMTRSLLITLICFLIGSLFFSHNAFACYAASSGTCSTFCETETALTTSKTTTKTTLQEKITASKEKLNKKLDDTDKANVDSISASMTSATNDTTFLGESLSKIKTATNTIRHRIFKNRQELKASRSVKPDRANVACQNITLNKGVVQGRALQNAALNNMVRDSVDAFQQVQGERDSAGTPRTYSQGATTRALYDDWRTKYCVESANNGLAPDGCGDDREDGDPNMENMDIKIADILFKPHTFPREQLLDAEKSVTYYLGSKPIKPVSPRDYENPESQQEVLAFRALMAKKNLSDSVLKYLASKRLPVIPSKQAKAILQNDIEPSSDLQVVVDRIGDQISFSQWLDIVMSKRYLGTDYYTRIGQMNSDQTAREISTLMSHRLVQQRERYQMLEKMLALVAADYAVDVDSASPSETSGKYAQ